MKITNLLSTALLLLTSTSPTLTSAAPTEQTPSLSLSRRASCPSVGTIEKWIKDKSKAKVGDHTIFYTAGAIQRQAENFSKDQVPDGNWWEKVFGNQYLEWIGECGEGEEQNKLLPRMGEALARQSTGTAYVLMVKGRPANRFWNDNEYPYLRDNGVKITAVNAEDFKEKKDYVHDQLF